jgi:hypothetical protein
MLRENIQIKCLYNIFSMQNGTAQVLHHSLTLNITLLG